VIALLKTFIDVLALRKGPEVIPASWLVLGYSLGILALAWVVQLALLSVSADGVLPVLTAYAAGLSFYAAVAFYSGFRRRILPMLSTIIACGSLLAILAVAAGILILPLVGGTVANLVALLVYFWSIPVKGHVVARTLGKHWFIGIAIAMVEFGLRFTLETSLLALQQGDGA